MIKLLVLFSKILKLTSEAYPQLDINRKRIWVFINYIKGKKYNFTLDFIASSLQNVETCSALSFLFTEIMPIFK